MKEEIVKIESVPEKLNDLEKRKLDLERQKEFEPIKEKAISFIRNYQNSLHSICDDFENDEARELMFDFEGGIHAICEEFIIKFNEL